jgi:GNAT superfamily N-acetyltransferase
MTRRYVVTHHRTAKDTAMTVEILPYDRARDTDVHDFHNGIRAWQTANGQVEVFGDDNDDLHNIDVSYLFSGGRFWVARDTTNGNVVGCVGLKLSSPTLGHLKRLAVHPDYHRQGIGTALVAALITEARAMGMTTIRLGTGEKENARPLYERAGFYVDGWVAPSADYSMTLHLRSLQPAGTP